MKKCGNQGCNNDNFLCNDWSVEKKKQYADCYKNPIEEKETVKTLVQAQKDYIHFLEDEIVKDSKLLIVHGWVCPQDIIDEGNRLREQIEKFK